jgi:hypothetical protein
MNNLIALVFLLTAGLRVASNAQTGSVLETEGIGLFQQITHWDYITRFPDYRLNLYYTFQDDTTVNNIVYHKYYCQKFQNESDLGKFYYGALREKDKKVYFLHRDSVRELVLYDFNLKIGDTIPTRIDNNLQAGPLYVVEIDSILLNDGIKRHYQKVSYHPPPQNEGYLILKGLGFGSGPFIKFTDGKDPYYSSPMAQVCKNGLGLFSNVNFYWPIPNNLLCDFFTDTEESARQAALFQVQPTLTSGLFSLSCDPSLFGRPLQIAFCSADGRPLRTIHTAATDQWEVNIHDLPSGIIFMKIQAEGRIFVKKIMKY